MPLLRSKETCVTPWSPFHLPVASSSLLLNSSHSVSTSVLDDSAKRTSIQTSAFLSGIPRVFAYVLRSLIWSWESKLVSFLAIFLWLPNMCQQSCCLLGPLCLAGSLPVSPNLLGGPSLLPPWSRCLGSQLPQACSASWGLVGAWRDLGTFSGPAFRVLGLLWCLSAVGREVYSWWGWGSKPLFWMSLRNLKFHQRSFGSDISVSTGMLEGLQGIHPYLSPFAAA